LVGEVASSSVSYDLGVKLKVYRRNGVLEYLVWRVLDEQLDWFVLREGRYEPLAAGAGGVLRSTGFPGLWVCPASLLKGGPATGLAVLQRGMQGLEHAEFVARLARTKLGAARPEQGPADDR